MMGQDKEYNTGNKVFAKILGFVKSLPSFAKRLTDVKRIKVVKNYNIFLPLITTFDYFSGNIYVRSITSQANLRI